MPNIPGRIACVSCAVAYDDANAKPHQAPFLDLQYRAKIGDRLILLELDGERIRVDDRNVRASMVGVGHGGFSLLLGDESHRASIYRTKDGMLLVGIDGIEFEVQLLDEHDILIERVRGGVEAPEGVRHVRAPMPGMVRAVHVTEGESVESGHGLLVLEAMKMENEIRSEVAGTVQTVHISAGSVVEKDQLLLDIDPAS